MKTLWSVSVFGLVPVPPTPHTLTNSRCSLRATSDGFDLRPLVILPDATERVLTKEEIARIRDELDGIAKRAG